MFILISKRDLRYILKFETLASLGVYNIKVANNIKQVLLEIFEKLRRSFYLHTTTCFRAAQYNVIVNNRFKAVYNFDTSKFTCLLFNYI